MKDDGPTDDLVVQRAEQRRDVRQLATIVMVMIGPVPKGVVFDGSERAQEESLRLEIGNKLSAEGVRASLAKFAEGAISTQPSPDELDRLRHLVTLSTLADLCAGDGDIDGRVKAGWESPDEPFYPDDDTD